MYVPAPGTPGRESGGRDVEQREKVNDVSKEARNVKGISHELNPKTAASRNHSFALGNMNIQNL